jgi:hypothetical protein
MTNRYSEDFQLFVVLCLAMGLPEQENDPTQEHIAKAMDQVFERLSDREKQLALLCASPGSNTFMDVMREVMGNLEGEDKDAQNDAG